MGKIDLQKVDATFLRAAMKCENSEELLKYAKENGWECSDEQAKEMFDSLKKELSEFSEEELVAISGGIVTENGDKERINKPSLGSSTCPPMMIGTA